MVKALKNLLLRNQKADDLETWYAASGARVLPNLFKEIFFKLVANDRSDKRFLLTSQFCHLVLSAPAPGLYTCIKSWNKLYKIRLQREEIFWNLKQMTEVTRGFCWHQNFVPWDCLPVTCGYIHLSNHEKMWWGLPVDIKILALMGCLPLPKGYV